MSEPRHGEEVFGERATGHPCLVCETLTSERARYWGHSKREVWICSDHCFVRLINIIGVALGHINDGLDRR